MRNLPLSIAFFAVSCAAISACTETTAEGPATPAAQAMRTGSQGDESSCLAAVSRQTNNGDVKVVSSEFSEANTEVIVGVGPQNAKWRCLVSKGSVAQVTSLTDEGAL